MKQYGCPECQSVEGFGEHNIVPGVAEINSFDEDGEPEYGGATDMDWNEQRVDPSAPALYHCYNCDADFDVPVLIEVSEPEEA